MDLHEDVVRVSAETGAYIILDSAEDFVHLADLLLVLEEDGRREVGHTVDRALHHQLILAHV